MKQLVKYGYIMYHCTFPEYLSLQRHPHQPGTMNHSLFISSHGNRWHIQHVGVLLELGKDKQKAMTLYSGNFLWVTEECEGWPRNVFEVINIQENVQRYLGIHTIKYTILAIAVLDLSDSPLAQG